jgi:hypothetical protein
MSQAYKLCPECREEFTLAASECSDCGVQLVFPDALEAETAPEEMPEVSELECVRVGPLPWTRTISEALSQVGVAHRVERDKRGAEEGGIDARRFDGEQLYGTWVKAEDFEAAKQIDLALFAHVDPDQLDAHEASDDETCPACEARLPSHSLECPDCGLSFG